MNYGKAVRIARAISGLQQRELAELVGLDPSHVSLIEMGKRRPSVSALEKLAKGLGVPLHLLTLLGAERDDLKRIGPDELDSIGESLARLLLQHGRPKSKSRRRPRRAA